MKCCVDSKHQNKALLANATLQQQQQQQQKTGVLDQTRGIKQTHSFIKLSLGPYAETLLHWNQEDQTWACLTDLAQFARN